MIKKKISALIHCSSYVSEDLRIIVDDWSWSAFIGGAWIRNTSERKCKTEKGVRRACRRWFKRHTNYEPEFD